MAQLHVVYLFPDWTIKAVAAGNLVFVSWFQGYICYANMLIPLALVPLGLGLGLVTIRMKAKFALKS